MQVNFLPWARQICRDNWQFQDDNAPGHRAQEVRYLHVESGKQALEQLPVSPDYNPFKHIWASLSNAIDAQHVKPLKHGDLAQALQEEWLALTLQASETLIESMPCRLASIIQAIGSHTKY